MDIHVVRPGDTLYELAYQYGVPMSRLIQDNQLPDPSQLVVGQTLVIQYPRSTYTVRSGDTLFSIARNAGVPLRQLLRNNPGLEGGDRIYPGQELVLTYQQEKQGVLSVNGYAYPNIAPALLQRTLPFLSSLAPFTYRPTVRGDLIPLSDNAMVAAAQVMGVRPLLHLANLTEADSFSGELAHALLSSPEARTRLADHLMELLHRNGYRGIDVDLESIFPEDAQNYVRFLFLLRERLEPLGYPLLAALAPKTSACQQGELYQGHDYRGLGEAADGVLLMTYEWGYAFGPPMAVAPLDQACGGVCPYRGPGGKNLAGHPQLRLRLAPLRATGKPGPLPVQSGGRRPGRPALRRHPLRPQGAGPVVPLCGRTGAGA